MTGSIFGLSEEGFYKGFQSIENTDQDVISRLYDHEGIESDEVDDLNATANKYYILKNGSASALARYNPISQQVEIIKGAQAYGVTPRNAEQTMALDALLNPDIPLVTLTGKAGTGKTLLALAAALECSRDYLQIHIARPVVPMQDMGFLPGGVEEKLAPYMLPLMDNLSVIKDGLKGNTRAMRRIDRMLEDEKIIVEPLAYIRGRSLTRRFVIIDEAQNLTSHEVKTIITRAGAGTKVVFTGDTEQIDTPKLDSKTNGLTQLVNKFKGQKLYAQINMIKGERSELAELAANLL